jgi:hypothetical protein
VLHTLPTSSSLTWSFWLYLEKGLSLLLRKDKGRCGLKVVFQALAALIMESTSFRNVTPCSLVDVNRFSASIFKFAACILLVACLVFSLRPRKRRQYLPPKRRKNSTRFHGVTYLKMLL